ncbi:MAG: DUF2442 domain-containing protein [Treponema sp.]|nr:DUF2442 domain-containing protein [Candidatus Treponema equifaecale]
MNFSRENARANKVWFDSDNMWLSLIDGRQLSIPKSYFSSFINATAEQLEKYELSGNGIGIHWEDLDEDLYVPNLLMENKIEKGIA